MARADTPDYPVHQEPVLLYKDIMDSFLAEDNPSELIALFSFYYYTAKWQGTTRVRATTKYAANGLKLGVAKIKTLKRRLREMGLIRDVIYWNDGHVAGHYVQLIDIWGKPTRSVAERVAKKRPFQAKTKRQIVKKATRLASNPIAAPSAINAYNDNTQMLFPLSAAKEAAADNGGMVMEKKKFDPNKPVTSAMFSRFWKHYPRKADKGAAINAWEKVCKLPINPTNGSPRRRPTWKQIRHAIFVQKKSERWQDKTYIKYPATWLNNNCWNDDPKEMVRFGDNGNGNGNNGAKPHLSAEDVMRAYFGEYAFKNTNFPPTVRMLDPALKLVAIPDPDTPYQMATSICRLDKWLKEQQKDRPANNVDPPKEGTGSYYVYNYWKHVPTPMMLICDYISYLEEQEQEWLHDISVKNFQPENKIFRKFLNHEQRQIGYDLFTGRPL